MSQHLDKKHHNLNRFDLSTVFIVNNVWKKVIETLFFHEDSNMRFLLFIFLRVSRLHGHFGCRPSLLHELCKGFVARRKEPKLQRRRKTHLWLNFHPRLPFHCLNRAAASPCRPRGLQQHRAEASGGRRGWGGGLDEEEGIGNKEGLFPWFFLLGFLSIAAVCERARVRSQPPSRTHAHTNRQTKR